MHLDPSSESLKVDIFPEGFIHKEKIRTVFEDSAHQLYFLPDKGPMYISDLSMNHFRHLQPNTLLEGKDCMSMIEDDEAGYGSVPATACTGMTRKTRLSCIIS